MAQAKLSPIQIERIALDAVHFTRNEAAPPAEEEGFTYSLDVGIEVRRSDSIEDEAVVSTKLEVTWEEQPGPFELRLTYTAHIVHDGSLDDETFETICRVRIPTMVMGFARPFVFRLMAEANESFRLPLVDLRQGTDAAEEEAG